MSEFHMPIERLEKRAGEKELVARLSSNEDVSLNNQKLAELLRSRIEELDRRLAILNSEREKRSGFRKSRRPGFVPWTTPTLWQRLSR
jgi:ribosome assembly protein YihI (activator of Der GTPase)